MKNLIIFLILLFPIIACAQTYPIQTVKIANDTTTFVTNLPAGTYIFDMGALRPYQLTTSGSKNLTLSDGIAVQLITNTGIVTLDTIYTNSLLEGLGTEEKPYIITDVWDLQLMRNDLDAYYILGNDINASITSTWNSGLGFEPIGSLADPFTGFIDGNKYSISNLYINRPLEDYVGLIGKSSGTIAHALYNLKLINVNITGKDYVGAAFGKMAMDISNCLATGNVTGNDYVGGIGGYSLHRSTLLASYVNVTGNEDVGGVFGYCDCGIAYSYAVGNIVGITNVGGLCGRTGGGDQDNCYSTGLINNGVAGATIGGMIGNFFPGECTYCFWDTITSGQSTSDGEEVGKTTAQMQQQATFTSWDFADRWQILEDQYYPYFQGYIDTVVYLFSENIIANAILVNGNLKADNLEIENNIFQSNTGNSVFIGEDAGAADDGTNNKNVFIGYLTGVSNTSGAYNTVVGEQGFGANTTGAANSAFGASALSDNIDGNSNAAFGNYALTQNTHGTCNTGFGGNALYSNSSGDYNTAVGYRSIYSNIYSNNTAVGYEAGYDNINGSGNIFLGYKAGFNDNTSNKLYIDNSDTAAPLIYGDFANDSIVINGNFTVVGNITTDNLGLASITENGQTGWRLSGQDSSYYGDIGNNAVDLSTNASASTTRGATGTNSFATGNLTTASGTSSFVGGFASTASGNYSFAFGREAQSTGIYSTAIGYNATASGDDALSLASSNANATGDNSVAIGNNATASGTESIAINGIASGTYSFCAGGRHPYALGNASTAIGGAINTVGGYWGERTNKAGGHGSFSEGVWTRTGIFSGSGYNDTYLSGGYAAHAEGYGTIAQNQAQHSEGQFNVGTSTTTIHETGIGTSDAARANAFEIYTDGKVWSHHSEVENDIVVKGQYNISTLNTAPTSASDTGTLGEIRITSSAIYLCTATNTWVKADLATW